MVHCSVVKMSRTCQIGLCLLLGWGSIAFGVEPELRHVRVLPQWVAQAQFAGFYMALEKGFYARHRLDVEILPGGPEASTQEALLTGQCDFISAFCVDMLASRANGTPVKNIAQLANGSAFLLVTRKEDNIVSPMDLEGKTVLLWPSFHVQAQALFRRFGIMPRVLPQRNSLDLFFLRVATACSVMEYNEYHQLLNSGWNEDELTVFRFEDFGLRFPEDGIYCLDSLWETEPKVCRAFVRATLEGWRYAFEHTQETLDVVMRWAAVENVATTRMHQAWMLDGMRRLIWPEGSAENVGFLPLADFMAIRTELAEQGLIEKLPTYEEFYENLAE